MTKQEFAELYDSIYYGHEAELKLFEKHYFIEWTDSGIDVFLMIDGNGTKISHIADIERSNVLTALFDFKLDGCNSLNDSYSEIEIIDIE